MADYPHSMHPCSLEQYGQPYVQHCSPPPCTQSTTNNTTIVTSQPPVMVVQPNHPHPSDYMVLAVLTCFLCNCPIGLVAVIFSYLSSEDARSGDYDGARTKGKVSLGLSIAGVCSTVILIIVVVVVLVI